MDDETFAYLPLFMGSSTKRLSVSSVGLGFSSFSLLASLPRAFPGITHFAFNHPGYWQAVVPSYVNYEQWEQLQSLRTNEIFPAHVIMGLARTSLRTLTVTIGGNDWYNISDHSGLGGFAFMENLCVSSPSSMACASLMSITAMSLLSILEINITDNATFQPSDFERLIWVVGTHGALVTFRFNQTFGPEHDIPVIDDHVLMPLMALGNLENVRINFAFRFGNDMVRTMANAWPRLVSLDFGGRGWAGCSQITLAGLLPLIQLPALGELSLSIDASVVDHTLNMPPVNTPNTHLLHLELNDSIIENPFLVAGFLSDLFPSLRTIDAWGASVRGDPHLPRGTVEEYKAKWQDVTRLVPLLAKVRQQEQRRNLQSVSVGGLTLQ